MKNLVSVLIVMSMVAVATGAQGQITPAAERGPMDLVILATGDVAYPRGWVEGVVADQRGRLFEGLAPLLESADLSFVNVEAPLTFSSTTKDKRFNIVMHPGRLKWLVDAGFNMFSVANNHIHDAGNKGVIDTLGAMKRARDQGNEIWWAGASRKVKDLWEPTWIRPEGKKLEIAFFAFAETESSLVPYPMSRLPLEAIKRAAKRADLVIVSVHSGREYVHVPGEDRARLLRSYIDAGADLVLGHHPHVVQGVEVYGDGLIFHSLGNLSFASMTKRHKKHGARLFGMAPLIEVRGGELVRAEVVPLYVNNTEPWVHGGLTLAPDPLVPIVLDGSFADHVSRSIREWTQALPGVSADALAALRTRRGRLVVRMTHRRAPRGAQHRLRREEQAHCERRKGWRRPRNTALKIDCGAGLRPQ